MEKIKVRIFDNDYNLTGSDAELITKVAQQVDQTMRELSKSLPGHSIIHIAVLTALNFAEALEVQSLKSAEPENFLETEIQKMITFAEQSITKNR